MNIETKAIIFADTAEGKNFKLAGIRNTDGGKLKKIHFGDKEPSHWVKSSFPDTEVVLDPKSIIYDSEIDLVIVREKHNQPDVVAEILSSGKNVRIV